MIQYYTHDRRTAEYGPLSVRDYARLFLEITVPTLTMRLGEFKPLRNARKLKGVICGNLTQLCVFPARNQRGRDEQNQSTARVYGMNSRNGPPIEFIFDKTMAEMDQRNAHIGVLEGKTCFQE